MWKNYGRVTARVTIVPAGDAALLVTVESPPDRVDARANRQVHELALAFERMKPAGLVETVPGYRTLLVIYDPLAVDYARAERWVRSALGDPSATIARPRRVEIPVIYGGERGPDLPFVARRAGLTEELVIAIHAEGEYPVYMMGFTPGFPYLGGMDERIAAPRLESPRLLVPGGSVGIAGVQTGVYPVDSPGGWRIIGWTPLKLFDPAAPEPFLLRPGDVVKFRRVEAA